MSPSRISKLNTALQFLVVGCGLTSAAFALPPPPREDVAALLRWAWHGGEREGERDFGADGGSSGGGAATPAAPMLAAARDADVAPPSLPMPAAAAHSSILAEPARLVLPLLVVAVGATTLGSGMDYFVKAARVLARFR